MEERTEYRVEWEIGSDGEYRLIGRYRPLQCKEPEMSHSKNRVSVRIRSANPIVWLDVWPDSCDLHIFPAGSSVDHLEGNELARLHAALGYILSSGNGMTAEGMAQALTPFDVVGCGPKQGELDAVFGDLQAAKA